jgi:hypothetical protein
VHAARRYAGLACIALALSATAAACRERDDVVVEVSQLPASTADAGMRGTAGAGGAAAGSGGTPAGTGGTQSPAPRCTFPDAWVWSANQLGTMENACRVAKNDPVVAFVDKLYRDQKLTPPPVGEGGNVTKCEVDLSDPMSPTIPPPYYPDTAFPGTYTVCPGWCLFLRGLASNALNTYYKCMNNGASMQQP